MVDQIRQELEKLNDQLKGITPYRLGVAAPGELMPADVNAHFMPRQMYDQLVDNIRRDGNLSTLPLCWRDEEGAMHILSGHHRVEASRDAGIEALLFLYTDAQMTEEQRTAVQLSHNSLVGMDDPNILRQQWQSIQSIEAKLYSGFDDKYFESFEPVSLSGFNETGLRFERVELLFVPDDKERLKAVMDKLKSSTITRFFGSLEQHERFAEAFMSFKEAADTYNSSVALWVMTCMAEKFCEYVEQKGHLPDSDGWREIEQSLTEDGLLMIDDRQT